MLLDFCMEVYNETTYKLSDMLENVRDGCCNIAENLKFT